MFGDLLMLAVTYYLWKAIYGSASEKVLNGFTLNEMIIYIFITFLTSLITLNNVSLRFLISGSDEDLFKEFADDSLNDSTINSVDLFKASTDSF